MIGVTDTLEGPPSPRAILIALFREAEINEVNTGSAESAADEIIDTLKHFGFLIVSNTPALVPVREAS